MAGNYDDLVKVGAFVGSGPKGDLARLQRLPQQDVDDLADALLFLMQNYSGEQHINVGWGKDVTITELATTVAEVVGYTGKFRYASEKPDGAPRKLLDVSRLTVMGWQPRISLRRGLTDVYKWYVENVAENDLKPTGLHGSC